MSVKAAEVEAKVWLEHQTGPREILPESLWTGITREGLIGKGWQSSLSRALAVDDFEHSADGLWLPPHGVSERNLELVVKELDQSSADLLIETYRRGIP
jgi:hypothetical protein